MKSCICKLCKTEHPGYDKLKDHWRREHPRQYVAVQTWLADVDEAVVVAEIVAKEGLSGNWSGKDG